MDNKLNIVSGLLLKVKKPFAVNPTSIPDKHHIVTNVLPVNEIIEIRYPYEWHFRNTRGDYFQASEADIRKHTKFFGYVDEKIKFNNSHTLADILIKELYSEKR
jgi:hypothetical protein